VSRFATFFLGRPYIGLMTTLIEVSGLRKLYRSSFGKPKITALDGIDFQVREGEMFGLLGQIGRAHV